MEKKMNYTSRTGQGFLANDGSFDHLDKVFSWINKEPKAISPAVFCVLPAIAIIVGIKPQYLANSRPVRNVNNRKDVRNAIVHRNISRLESMSRSVVNGMLQSVNCAPVEYFEEEVTHILPKTGRKGSTWILVPEGEYTGRVSEVSEAIQADGSMVGELINDLESLGLEAGFVDAENELLKKEAELKELQDKMGRLLADRDFQMAEFGDIHPKLAYAIRKTEKAIRYAEKGIDYAQYRMDQWMTDNEEEIAISYSSEKEDLNSLSDETLQSMAQTDDRMLLAIISNILGERNIRKLNVLKAKLSVFKANLRINPNWKRNNVTKQYHKVYFNTHEKSGGVYENVSIRTMADYLADADRFVAALNNPRPNDKLDASKIDPDMLKIAQIKWEIKKLEGKVADYENDLVERKARRVRWDNQQAMKDVTDEVTEFVVDLASDVPAWQQYINWADAEEKASNRRAKQSPCRMAGTVVGAAKAEKAIDLRWLYGHRAATNLVISLAEVENEEALDEVEEKETEIDEFDAWLMAIVER